MNIRKKALIFQGFLFFALWLVSSLRFLYYDPHFSNHNNFFIRTVDFSFILCYNEIML